ncbi:MAG: archaeal heat shock protein Hsp20 [Candidatus Thermoplasmatota archaeon]
MRRRRFDPWDIADDFFDEFFRRRRSMFSDIDEEFERMRRQMDTLYRKAMSGELKSPKEGGPYVYGWSFKVVDGKPYFQEFGNTRMFEPGEREGEFQLPGTREPMTDVIESEKTVSITAEMPGIEKSDVDIDANEESVVIKVEKGKRRYYKEIELPCKVNTNTAKATFNNGVLDIVFEKLEERKGGRKLQIK